MINIATIEPPQMKAGIMIRLKVKEVAENKGMSWLAARRQRPG
jgi:hypothetical protein